jgi:pimeloyl-ACP methyl ester carboxylesterase
VPLSFDDPFGSNIDHAREIAHAVDALVARAHAGSIAIVAHSMGGLASRWYLAHQPHPRVSTAVSLATPHAGTWAAWLGWGRGAAEMRPGSDFLQQLGTLSIPQHVRFYSLRAPFDLRVFPASSAWLSGTQCSVAPGRGHRRILRQASVCSHVVRLIHD